MRYVGNKKNYMKQLNQHFNLCKDILGLNTFYDLFGGGMNVSINVDFDDIITNDIDSALVAFLNKVINTNGKYLDDVMGGG